MYISQRAWVELDRALHAYRGPDAYADVLEPWPAANADEGRWLADFAGRTATRRGAATDEDLCRLYAASRVAQVLLLRFQAGRVDRTDWPGPAVTVEGYRVFLEAVGFHVPEVAAFHPFYHEVVAAHAAQSAEHPVEVVEPVWPPLMLGDLMVCRGGAVVAGGTEHLDPAVAEGSTLFWAHRRKNRPYDDPSHGWGSNSQWRTRLRRVYRTPAGFEYNADAPESLTGATGTVDGFDAAAMIEVVRHRCRIRATADADLYPYRYSFTEAAEPSGATAPAAA